MLFAFGLLNASLFAASILPLSTAHVICEGMGFEAGIDHKFNDAPIFYSLYTGMIVVGAAVILIPRAPLEKILILSQVGNGVWLPVVLIFMLLLVNRRDLMGDYVNTPTFNVVAWVTAVAVIILTLVLVYVTILHPHRHARNIRLEALKKDFRAAAWHAVEQVDSSTGFSGTGTLACALL